jgi:hypothetical protein
MNFFGGNNKKTAEKAEIPTQEPAVRTPSYGIQDAILLMRTLPVDQNVELVVSVIKRTLESLEVGVPDLIEDASRRQEDLLHQVAVLEDQILELERQIQLRREEIVRLKADYAETTTVKERLEIAEAVYQGLTTHVYNRPAV